MSDTSCAVTYTSVYTDSAETGPPRVIVYGYDRLPIQLVAPPSPDYIPGPDHPPSPDYVPDPEHPPLPIEIPYVPEPEYPEYLAPSDVEAPLEDQPLPTDASPIVESPDYVADSDSKEDSKEDPEDDQADYPADGGDGDDEPSDDDDDDDTDDEDPEEEPFEEDDEEEEEHLAPVDSSVIPIVDHVLLARETEALEANEPTHAPGSPISIPLSQTCLRRARKTARPELPMSASMEACIARHAALPSPPLLKRAFLTTPAPGFELGESSAAGAAWQPGPTKSDLRRCRVEQAGYGITDTWDEIVDKMMEIASTTLEGVNERVTELDTTVRDRPDHRRTAMLMDKEAMYSREAWAFSKDRSLAIATHVRTLETQKMAPKKRTTRATPATTTTPSTTCLDMVELPHEGCWIGCCLCNAMDGLEKDDHKKVERYIGGLPDMIHGSVKASKPQSMQEVIEFSTEMMDKKMLTHAEHQAKQKRKLDDTSRNNQHQQQPFKRNNVAWAYTAGPGDKKPYEGIKHLCPKCNYHHDGPCTQKCTNCRKIGNWARDCKSRPAAANNNQRAQGANAKGITCFECGIQGHYKNDCPKLNNGNQWNRAGNGNVMARAYAVGYGITDAWDEIVDKMMEMAPTTLEGVNERVIELDTTVRQRTDEFEVRFEDAQFDRALLRAQVNTLYRDRPYHRRTAMLMDREAMYSR
nr:hypothetical protein [Tanacetum cinerariifolium]